MNCKDRIKRLRKELEILKLDGIMITNPANRLYLSGFMGDTGMLFIDSKDAFIATDSRFYFQAKQECPDYELIQAGNESPYQMFMKRKKLEGRTIGFESDNVVVSQLKAIRKRMKGVKLVGVDGLVIKIRSIKDHGEIEKIKAAQKITDQAFQMLLGKVKPGMTEIELAWITEKYMREKGAQKLAFPTIVASGPNAALPHAVASKRKIKKGEVLLFDMGCVVDEYCSDMTRTVFIGKPSEKMRAVYNLVLEAHLMVFELTSPGKKVAEIDRISREYIYKAIWKGKPLMGSEKGQGRYEHGLGHGVGVEVHELPVLSMKRKKDVIQPGQVITNEPAIYIEGEGGVRIEDMMLITKDGVVSLTKSPKDLIVL